MARAAKVGRLLCHPDSRPPSNSLILNNKILAPISPPLPTCRKRLCTKTAIDVVWTRPDRRLSVGVRPEQDATAWNVGSNDRGEPTSYPQGRAS